MNTSPVKTFTAGAAIARYLRVKLTSGKLALAGGSDKELGVTEVASFEDGDPQSVRLRNAEGTGIAIASGAISEGAEIFAAANGQVAATGTVAIGTALMAATAAGDHIEYLRY